MQPNRHAFTLIELLVVLTIVTILIAVLLPSLQEARKTAKRIQCASNLRQIGFASITYTNDFNQWIIPTSIWPGYYWIGSGTSGFGLNNGYYFPDRFPKIAICPECPYPYPATSVPTTYGLNSSLSPLAPNANNLHFKPYKQVRRPDKVIHISDAGLKTTTTQDTVDRVSYVGYWHQSDTANVFLFDGTSRAPRKQDSSFLGAPPTDFNFIDISYNRNY